MTKVLALIESPDHVCYRYRIAAFAEVMAERGIALEVECVRKGLLARTAQLLWARRADVVLLQRKLMAVSHVRLLHLAAKRLVYDMDDVVFQRHSFYHKGTRCRKLPRRFRATTAAADAVIAGNDYLAQLAAENTDPARIHVIPTCVDPRRYAPAAHDREGSPLRLAWIGGATTLESLRRAAPWLQSAGRQVPGLELRLICDQTLEVPGLRVVFRPWSSDTEAAELANADVGISWLPDDEFTRGKCGLKLLQYMAAGLPVVANPVGVHPQIVAHDRTGFLVSTPDQWADAIARLAADPALRQSMGRAGRQRVQQDYSIDRWGPRLADLLTATSGQRSAAERRVA